MNIQTTDAVTATDTPSKPLELKKTKQAAIQNYRETGNGAQETVEFVHLSFPSPPVILNAIGHCCKDVESPLQGGSDNPATAFYLSIKNVQNPDHHHPAESLGPIQHPGSRYQLFALAKLLVWLQVRTWLSLERKAA